MISCYYVCHWLGCDEDLEVNTVRYNYHQLLSAIVVSWVCHLFLFSRLKATGISSAQYSSFVYIDLDYIGDISLWGLYSSVLGNIRLFYCEWINRLCSLLPCPATFSLSKDTNHEYTRLNIYFTGLWPVVIITTATAVTKKSYGSCPILEKD